MKIPFSMIVMIDWGTEQIRWSLGDEIFSMPNVAAAEKKKIVAVGEAAEEKMRTDSSLDRKTPPPGILFDDPDAITAQLRELLRRCAKNVPWHNRLLKPRILASVPRGFDGIENRGFSQILKENAQGVVLCEAAMAAAIGTGYSAEIDKPYGILELGAGLSQYSMIHRCGVADSLLLRRGGRDLDAALKRHLKQKYHILPSATEIADVKTNWNCHEKYWIGDASIPREELWRVYTEALSPLCNELKDKFEATAETDRLTVNQELLEQVKTDGIVLSGGLSLMPGLTEYLSEQTAVPFRTAKNPVSAVMRGLLKIHEEAAQLWKFW